MWWLWLLSCLGDVSGAPCLYLTEIAVQSPAAGKEPASVFQDNSLRSSPFNPRRTFSLLPVPCLFHAWCGGRRSGFWSESALLIWIWLSVKAAEVTKDQANRAQLDPTSYKCWGRDSAQRGIPITDSVFSLCPLQSHPAGNRSSSNLG